MKLTENDFARIAQLGRQGLNCQQISESLHVSHSCVWINNQKRRLGVPKGLSGSKTTWTDEDDAALRQMVDGQGMTISAAAARLGRSLSNCYKRCVLLKVSSVEKSLRWTQADMDKVFALWQSGMKPKDIAQATGINVNRVRYKIERWQRP